MLLNLKYNVNQSKEAGILYILGAPTFLLIPLFVIYYGWDVFSHALILLLFLFPVFLFAIWFFVTGVYHLKLNTIDYIRLENGKLSIHKGLFRQRQEVNVDEIEKVYIRNDKWIFILQSQKEVEIHINLLFIKDYERLLNIFNNSVLISKL